MSDETNSSTSPGPEGDGNTTGAPSRRAVLGWGGAGLALGAAAAGGTVAALTSGTGTVPAGMTGEAVPFHGAHQAGIASAVQDRLHFAAFDVKTKDRAELVRLLQDWTRAAERMTAGLPVGEGAVGGLPEAPPDDTGEALGLKPNRLTLTVGFGPSLFAKGRFGLEDRRPEALIDLELFPGDNLDPVRSGGDLCVQACADDPQVAVHAIRQLARIGFGKTVMRWSQLGFGKTSSTTPEEQTPRNMMGFKDGTRNISGTDTAALDKHVWVSATDAPGASSWMVGGSYLVARRIRMNIEIWDRTPLQEQEDIFGRDKAEGAPVGKSKERDEPFLKAMKPEAHVRLAHPDTNDGATILRRGYSFTDGTDGLGRLDAGLFFLAYQRDVRKGFVPIQRNLAKSDVLNEYIQHVGSAVFAVPPGVRDADDWWGRALLS
ncbi:MULTISPECIES: iron uptake transporter deferrochelatase/peroxidase subunit [unclassified Streptomyces]|uniref:iron uptake transporter deferrochelatase/peroxidase subunit n=1 Tax=unclassified Streptomyces TaxID=2593676 RepID=UPI002258900B|nr:MULTISPECIES: iron uptake transporter deferrochelatase/peroxidase subunit [unclassified Streptomyces]MCX4525618.1 iron uptake transporter deferrochelatase/peroxidase subunit [Streptomyces sp. NBC_01551]MCX4543910.1 iron uptake transporter deferrochelatase/peroxidase subunit [Streptomyces sp. NBC_01565]